MLESPVSLPVRADQVVSIRKSVVSEPLEGLDILLGRVLIVAPVDKVGENAP